MRKINSHQHRYAFFSAIWQNNWKQLKTLGNAVFLYFDLVNSFMLFGLDEGYTSKKPMIRFLTLKGKREETWLKLWTLKHS